MNAVACSTVTWTPEDRTLELLALEGGELIFQSWLFDEFLDDQDDPALVLVDADGDLSDHEHGLGRLDQRNRGRQFLGRCGQILDDGASGNWPGPTPAASPA